MRKFNLIRRDLYRDVEVACLAMPASIGSRFHENEIDLLQNALWNRGRCRLYLRLRFALPNILYLGQGATNGWLQRDWFLALASAQLGRK